MYEKPKTKIIRGTSELPETTRRFKRLSNYINRQVVDIEGDALEQRAEVHFDDDEQAMLGYCEGDTDPFTNPRMSLFDHVAASGDPDAVQRIRDSVKANKSVEPTPDTTTDTE